MADIDLKTATPDTSLPTTGFLFGADSQASASPSVYSTQTVATTLLGSTSLTGATVTADSPVLNLAQTWNNSGVTFTGLKFNVPTDSSASGSLLMDLQVGGVSKLRSKKDGTLQVTGGGLEVATGSAAGSANRYMVASNAVYMWNGGQVSWSSSSTDVLPQDLFLTRRGTANLRLGAADTTGTTAPTAQTLSVQSWTSSTNNNQPGANFTIAGSQGTGTGAGGSIIFQVAPAGAVSNGVQNALATALTINSAGQMIGGAGSASVPTFAFTDTNYGSGQSGMFYAANGVAFGGAGGSYYLSISNQALTLSSGVPLAWSSGNGTPGSADTILRRDAANTLALRNGTNAQTFRVYGTTDGTNSNRVEIYSDPTGYGSIGNATSGSGTFGDLFVVGGALRFQTAATYATRTDRWRIESNGHFNASVDNTYDIGATSSGRPRHLYLAGNITSNGGLTLAAAGYVTWPGRASFDAAATDIVRLGGSSAGGALQLTEMTAPAAPATNDVRIYAEDNGAGKTRLMARFATGAAVQIAIEP